MQRVSTDQQAFGLPLKGRIDIYPQEKNFGYQQLSKHLPAVLINDITHIQTPFITKHSYLLLPKSHPNGTKLLKLFNHIWKCYVIMAR